MISEKLVIRDFCESDACEIVRLHHESQENFEEEEVSEDFIISTAQRSDFRFLIMYQDNEVIGFAGFLFNVNTRRSEIGPICINPGHRDRGLGTLVLEHVINILEQINICRCIVKVKANNKRALSFFKGNGFIKEGYFKRYTQDNDDVIQLRKFI